MLIASAGSAMFLLGCVMSLFNLSYGITLGSFAACLSWPYFGLLIVFFPFGKLIWFVRFHHHGADQIAAVVCLLSATLYTITQRKRLTPPVARFWSGDWS